MKYLRVPRRLPSTSKRGFVVGYEKKIANATTHSTPAYFQKQWHTRPRAVYIFGSKMMGSNHTKNWKGAAVLARMGFGHVELKEYMMKFLR